MYNLNARTALPAVLPRTVSGNRIPLICTNRCVHALQERALQMINLILWASNMQPLKLVTLRAISYEQKKRPQLY